MKKRVKVVKVCNSENYLIKIVKPHGNSGGVSVPISWLGKEVVVVLKEDLEKE